MQNINLHGSIFLLLKKFIENTYGASIWKQLFSGKEPVYEMHENYPVSEMLSIVTKIAGISGVSETEIKEKFGESLVPDLLSLYQSYVNPSWKTFEMLLYSEHIMHRAVRSEESKADPPVINVSRVHDKLLMIDYFSERKMGSLAIGIIRGIAQYYNEGDRVHVIAMSNPNEARVLIRVEFD